MGPRYLAPRNPTRSQISSAKNCANVALHFEKTAHRPQSYQCLASAMVSLLFKSGQKHLNEAGFAGRITAETDFPTDRDSVRGDRFDQPHDGGTGRIVQRRHRFAMRRLRLRINGACGIELK